MLSRYNYEEFIRRIHLVDFFYQSKPTFSFLEKFLGPEKLTCWGLACPEQVSASPHKVFRV